MVVGMDRADGLEDRLMDWQLESKQHIVILGDGSDESLCQSSCYLIYIG